MIRHLTQKLTSSIRPSTTSPLPSAEAQSSQPCRQPSDAAASGSWMSQLVFEAGFDPRLRTGPKAAQPAGVGYAWTSQGAVYSRDALQSGHQTEPPLQAPRTPQGYQDLLTRLFDKKAEQAANAMLREPVLKSMRYVWTVGDPVVNRRVAEQFLQYFLPPLGKSYRYNPCPVLFNDQGVGGFAGLYHVYADRALLNTSLLKGSFAEFIAVVVHEQMHCLQWRLMGQLQLRRSGASLSSDERAVANYWLNEEAKYRSALANGSEMSEETLHRYLLIGQEHHANKTGQYISRRLSGSA